jgi:CRISPR-associated protein Csm4
MISLNIPVFKLHFSGALHLSDVRLDYGVSEKQYHSDSLSAALLAVSSLVGRSFPSEGKLPFTLSSLFPFHEQDGNCTYFLPKPKVRLNTTNALEPKVLKAIQWVDQLYFQQICRAEPLSIETRNVREAYLSQRDTKALMSFQTLPRVKVSRNETDETEIFYMQMIRFAQGAGLYFMAWGDELDWLRDSIRLLGLEGIGTDRNVGNGQFHCEESTLNLTFPDNADAMTNLSLFCPESHDQLKNMMIQKGNTDLIKRGGWISSESGLGIRKQPIYMFAEGSVFGKTEQKFPAKLGLPSIDVSPPTLPLGRTLSHPVFRNGQALFFPIKLAP